LQHGNETGQGEYEGPQDGATTPLDVDVEEEELPDEKSEPSTEDTQKWPIGRSRARGAKRMVIVLCCLEKVSVCI
jgi:hypothetical protein